MITDAFFALITSLINAIASALPVWQVTPDNAAVAAFFFNVTLYNSILPITEMFAVISLMTTVFVALNALKWGKALVNIVRGSGA